MVHFRCTHPVDWNAVYAGYCTECCPLAGHMFQVSHFSQQSVGWAANAYIGLPVSSALTSRRFPPDLQHRVLYLMSHRHARLSNPGDAAMVPAACVASQVSHTCQTVQAWRCHNGPSSLRCISGLTYMPDCPSQEMPRSTRETAELMMWGNNSCYCRHGSILHM